MNLDQAVLSSLKSNNFPSEYRIYASKPSLNNFYLKLKPLKPIGLSTTLAVAPLPIIKKTNSSVFLTQIIPKKTNKASFIKIFSTCLKNKEDREYSEVIEVSKWMKDVVFLNTVSKFKLKILAQHVLSKHYRRGDYLFKADEAPGHLYIILNGEVTLIRNSKKIDFRTLRDVVGENGLVCNKTPLYDAKTSTEVHALCIPIPLFLEILGSDQLKSSIDTMKILASIDLFGNIPILKLIILSNKLQTMIIKKGETIYNFDQKPHSFYIILHGKVQEKTKISEGLDYDVKIFKSGDYFGSRDLILNYPRRSSAEGVTRSVIHPIPQFLFNLYMQKKMVHEDYKHSDTISPQSRSYSVTESSFNPNSSSKAQEN
jgi:CRP-like cAMP-binding protein